MDNSGTLYNCFYSGVRSQWSMKGQKEEVKRRVESRALYTLWHYHHFFVNLLSVIIWIWTKHISVKAFISTVRLELAVCLEDYNLLEFRFIFRERNTSETEGILPENWVCLLVCQANRYSQVKDWEKEGLSIICSK